MIFSFCQDNFILPVKSIEVEDLMIWMVSVLCSSLKKIIRSYFFLLKTLSARVVLTNYHLSRMLFCCIALVLSFFFSCIEVSDNIKVFERTVYFS